MTEEVSWSVWRMNWATYGWLAWIAFFIIWEAIAIIAGYKNTLTAHLRPIFLSHPLTWWVTFGVWLWIGVHLLAPAIESTIMKLVRGG